MDEKLNDYLIQEINKSIESLNQNKDQLIEELKKYEGRYGALEKSEFEQDLSKIDSELESRRLDLAKIETRREIMAQIREVQEKEEADYQKLLKEREDCKAEINGLAGKREFVNGALGPIEKQHNLEQELEKMNASIAKFDKLREQHKNDLNEHTAVIEELLKKYNIREKYKSELETKQDAPAPETKKAESTVVPSEEKKEPTPVIDDTQKDNKTEQVETITVEGPAENEQPHKETDASDVLKNIDKSLEDLKNPAQKAQTNRVVVPKSVEPKQQPSTEPKVAKQETTITTQEPKESTTEQKEPINPSTQTTEPTQKTTDGQTQEESITVEPEEFFTSAPKKIQNITCSVIDGKLVYTISGIDEDGKQFSVDRETTPKKLTREEKRSLSKKIDKYSIGNIDAQIYRILKNDSFFKNTSLIYDYMDQIDRLSSFEEGAKEDDMMIKYDLQNLHSTKLSFLQKGQIKSIARRNFIEGIAEYIKPKSRFKEFIDRFKQKALPEGKEKETKREEKGAKHEKSKLMTNEERIYLLYKYESKDKDFDLNQFCETFGVTPEQRKELEVYEKVNADSKTFHEGIKNPVTYKESGAQPDKETEQKVNEQTTKEQDDKEL